MPSLRKKQPSPDFLPTPLSSTSSIGPAAVQRLSRMRGRGDIKEERIAEMKELGRQVFELASEDAQEFREMKGFFEAYLNDIDRRRGTGAAVEEDSDAADAESGAPVVKKIKLFDD